MNWFLKYSKKHGFKLLVALGISASIILSTAAVIVSVNNRSETEQTLKTAWCVNKWVEMEYGDVRPPLDYWVDGGVAFNIGDLLEDDNG